MPSNSSSTQVVSIHASVKDATKRASSYLPLPNVSIHASVKDATAIKHDFSSEILFQSTHL